MLRHRIHVHADLEAVLAILDRPDFVAAQTHERLKTVQLQEGVGTMREVDGRCEIDLFDEDEGVEVARMVGVLRDAGLVVEQETHS